MRAGNSISAYLAHVLVMIVTPIIAPSTTLVTSSFRNATLSLLQ